MKRVVASGVICRIFASSSCAIYTSRVCLLAAAMWKEAANPIVKDSGVRRAAPRGASQPEPAAATVAPGASQPGLSHAATPAVALLAPAAELGATPAAPGALQPGQLQPRAADAAEGDQILPSIGDAIAIYKLKGSTSRSQVTELRHLDNRKSRRQRALELEITSHRIGDKAHRFQENSRLPDQQIAAPRVCTLADAWESCVFGGNK